MVSTPGVRMYFCSSSTGFLLVACYEVQSNRLWNILKRNRWEIVT